MKAFHTASLALALLALPCLAAEDKVLNLFNWADYFAPDTVAGFEKETGIKVRYDAYDSDETLQAKILTGDTGYDLVWPSNDFMAKQIQAGVYRKLDKSKLPNLKNLDSSLMAMIAESDPGNQYGVPYMWGTVGIGYDRTAVSAILGKDMPANTMELVFNPEIVKRLSKCGVALQDSASAVLPLALRYIGRDPLHPKPEDYEAAVQMLKKVRPYVRHFLSSPTSGELLDGDLCVTIAYSGSVLAAAGQARKMGLKRDLSYSIPNVGTLMWFDGMVIPRLARHPDNAHAFINYILRPEVIAKISNHTRYANTNAAATPLLDPQLKADPNIYPDEATRQKLFVLKVQSSEASKLEKRYWTSFKGV